LDDGLEHDACAYAGGVGLFLILSVIEANGITRRASFLRFHRPAFAARCPPRAPSGQAVVRQSFP
jgi:hypothetical protein